MLRMVEFYLNLSKKQSNQRKARKIAMFSRKLEINLEIRMKIYRTRKTKPQHNLMSQVIFLIANRFHQKKIITKKKRKTNRKKLCQLMKYKSCTHLWLQDEWLQVVILKQPQQLLETLRKRAKQLRSNTIYLMSFGIWDHVRFLKPSLLVTIFKMINKSRTKHKKLKRMKIQTFLKK